MAERCDKLVGIDVAAYLDDPAGARWSTFGVHVRTCPDCREEIAAWQSLRASLATERDGHPAEDLLLAYMDEHASLAKSVAERIEGHLAQCASCRDEVGVLGAMMIRPREAIAAAAGESRVSFWHRMLGVLTGPAWRPALAVALLVGLMVPTLRWIDRESALMQLGAEQNRDGMMVMSEDDIEQQSRGNVVGTVPPAAVLRDEARVDSAEETRPLVVEPPPPASAPVVPRPKVSDQIAAGVPTRPQPSQALEAEDGRALDTQLGAQRRGASADARAFSATAMRKDRGLSAPVAPPTLEFVPGGRVTLEPGDYDRVLLRVRFVRGVNEAPARSGSTNEVAGHVLVPAKATQLTIRVTTRDGRQSMQQVNIALPESEGASSMQEILVPADWFTSGENRIEIVEGEREVVRGRLEVLL